MLGSPCPACPGLLGGHGPPAPAARESPVGRVTRRGRGTGGGRRPGVGGRGLPRLPGRELGRRPLQPRPGPTPRRSRRWPWSWRRSGGPWPCPSASTCRERRRRRPRRRGARRGPPSCGSTSTWGQSSGTRACSRAMPTRRSATGASSAPRRSLFVDVGGKHAVPRAGGAGAGRPRRGRARPRRRARGLRAGDGAADRSGDVKRVRAVVSDRPLLIGSGVTPDTVGPLLALADGVIVGTWLKRDGRTTNPVDPDRARALARAAAV